jgi:hypothetical protein
MEADTHNAAFPESYVVEIDGKIGSVYRIYIEAIKAGMELKQKFPHSQIKVHDAAATEPAKRQARDFDSTHFPCP